MLLHDLQQGGLSLRRGAIDFIHQQQVLENRPLFKKQHTAAVLVLIDDVRAQNVGRHQGRCALHTTGLQSDDL